MAYNVTGTFKTGEFFSHQGVPDETTAQIRFEGYAGRDDVQYVERTHTEPGEGNHVVTVTDDTYTAPAADAG